MYANERTATLCHGVICATLLFKDVNVALMLGSHCVEDHAAHWPAALRPLVMGFGNVLLSDDGAGVQLVEQLKLTVGTGAAQFIDAGTMSFSLLSYIESTDSMLILDAGELNSTPGTIALFEDEAMDDFLKSARRRTVHEVGLVDLLDTARLLDTIPKRRALLCIQPSHIGWGESLSAPVGRAFPEALRQASALLERWKPN